MLKGKSFGLDLGTSTFFTSIRHLSSLSNITDRFGRVFHGKILSFKIAMSGPVGSWR